MHQKGLLEVAAALEDTRKDPTSEEMIDWILHNEEYKLYIYMPVRLVPCERHPGPRLPPSR